MANVFFKSLRAALPNLRALPTTTLTASLTMSLTGAACPMPVPPSFRGMEAEGQPNGLLPARKPPGLQPPSQLQHARLHEPTPQQPEMGVHIHRRHK
ncbi:unnamed protein product [Parnassius apollo]|uniref:(apollo) hypothetical protein n=1 Tax=Parnassius apollo TaxID=110799 RepID=A0A8S3W173_PARAO|nr:unnamed protein product [Parnassius apollo]